MSRSRYRSNFSQAERLRLYQLAGVAPPKAPPKYRSAWTYYNGRILHTTGSGCAPLPPERCPICTNPQTKADRKHWYQSRSEARFASKLDMECKLGLIRQWQRSPNLLLVDGLRRDRIRYKPDFDVWVASDPSGPPDRRYEVKGAKAMIAPQSLLRIKLYRAAAARGEQPPLYVVNGDGVELAA